MVGNRRSVLLGFGLCLMAWCVHSMDVNIYGNNPFDDARYKLATQTAKKEKLEMLLEKATNEKEKQRLQKDLEKVNIAIGKIESTSKVLYRDHIKAIEENTEKLEKEKNKIQKELESSLEQYAHLVADLEAANEKYRQQIDAYRSKLGEISQQSDITSKENETLKKSITQQNMNYVELKTETEKITKGLQDMKNIILHRKLQNVGTSQEIAIPYEDVINSYHKRLGNAINSSVYKKKLSEFNLIEKQLDGLCERMYKEGQFCRELPIEFVEHSLDVDEMDYILSESGNEPHHTNRLLDEMKEDLTNRQVVTEKAQKDVEASENFTEKIARKRAYIKAIKRVLALKAKCRIARNHTNIILKYQ